MAMNMLPRGAATVASRSRQGVRPVYEDFKPLSEWKYEEGVDVLLFHLPGFAKEQVRILAESRGILRVFGERFVGGNKWSRFKEEVSVPQDCNINEIRARFEGGVLRVTMPKKAITPKPDQQAKPQNLQENPSTSVSKESQMEEHDKYEETFDHKKANGVEDHNNEGEKDPRNEEETSNEKKESEVLQEKKDKHGLEGYKRAIKSHLPRSLNEDRQLLVNMGVAVMVIVGLGAYISQSFGSSI